MTLRRMHRAPTLFVDRERVGIALECAAMGREELGLEYLNGENDVSVFRKSNRRPNVGRSGK